MLRVAQAGAWPSIRMVWAESWALVLHTFMTLLEAEQLQSLDDEARALDRAALLRVVIHTPNDLNAEFDTYRRRLRDLAGHGAAPEETVIRPAGYWGSLPNDPPTAVEVA